MMTPQHIVIVDDSPLNLRMYTTMLSTLPNVKIHRFSSSQAVLEWTAANDVDCFVIDIHMPAPNGIELARMVRANPRSALTPIVIVTGDPDRDIRYAALDAGVNDFVQTPVDPREFQGRVGTFLELHAARKQLDGPAVEPSERSRDHAARLEDLWRIATDPSFDRETLLDAVLTHSAAALQPGEAFVSRVFRLEGDVAVLESASAVPVGSGLVALPVGARIAVAGSTLELARKRGETLALGEQIIVPVRVDGVDYALMYVSSARPKRAFDADDVTYATIVAAFLQTLCPQRRQRAG